MHTADVLSQKFQSHDTDVGDAESYIDEYEVLILEQFPAYSKFLDRIKTELQKDPTSVRIVSYTQNQWPAMRTLSPAVRQYGSVASELTTVHGLLMRNGRLEILPSLRHILERLHCGHQGFVRCRARARESVWWPGISADLQDYVQRCLNCQRFQAQVVEPLLQTPLPVRP